MKVKVSTSKKLKDKQTFGKTDYVHKGEKI